jgi:hypothetical protein
MTTMAIREESLRVRVPEKLRERWEVVLDKRNISSQRALLALIEFAVDEDPLIQAMLFKQTPVEDRDELSKIVLKRLAAKKKAG